MSDIRKTRKQLIDELNAMRQRVTELGRSEADSRQAEEKPSSEKEFTDSVINALTETFFVFDPEDGTARRWNRAFREVTGYSDEEIASLRAPDSYYSQRDLSKAASATQTVVEEGIAKVEMSLITKEGSRIPFEYCGVLIKSPEGRPWICSIGRDITERRQAAEVLKQRTRELSERLKELDCLYGISSLAGRVDISIEGMLQRIVEIVPRAWQYPGITCARVTMDGQQLTTENFEETAWRQAADILAHGERVGVVEVFYIEERPELDEGPFLKEERSLINSIAEQLGGIAERKKAEAATLEAERRYRAIFDNRLVMVYVHDSLGVFFEANDCALETLGYTRQELSKLTFQDIAHPDDLPRAFKAVNEGFAKGYMDRPLELRLFTKSGQVLWAQVFGMPLEWSADRYTSVGIALDITDRKKAEQEIAHHTKRLEALHAVARTVSHALDLEGLLHSTLRTVVQVVGADVGVIYLLNVAERSFSLAAQEGVSMEDTREVSTVELEEEDLQRVLEWRDPYAPLSQVQSENVLRLIAGAIKKEQLRSFAVVPLWVKGGLRGVLSVASRNRSEFERDDIDLLAGFGNEIAVGIENALLHGKTRELSVTDELTGLHNRRHFYEVIDIEMSRAQRYGRPFALTMLDLDGFKRYNDTFGHGIGDTALKSFARMLKSGLRKADVAFRYGGDEFAVVMPATDATTASRIIDRVRSRWLQMPKARALVLESPLGFSAGIAEFPEDAETADGLVFLADTALIRSKRAGGYTSTLISELGKVSTDALGAATLDQVYALAATVDAKDPLTYGHSKRVATVSQILGRALGLPEDELVNLRAAALVHDIGKVGVPDSLLTKAGKPADHEWRQIRQHAAEGARIVAHVRELGSLVPVIRHHHEWYDGTGYPDGLKGEEIPLAARILSVADAYDTMTTARPYRDLVSHWEASEELKRFSGTQFDPGIVDAFCSAIGDDEPQ